MISEFDFPCRRYRVEAMDRPVKRPSVHRRQRRSVTPRSTGAENREFIRSQFLLSPMTDGSQTGPWVLALVTLAIGIGAVVAEVRRRRFS